MISVDPVEPIESSGTCKISKGEEGEKEVLPEPKETLKEEAVDALTHHRLEK